MEIYERIIELRKIHLSKKLNKKLTQNEFGELLGVSRSVIVNIEYNRVDIKEHMLKLICQTFNVNEDWLRYGNEPVFKEQNLDLVKQMVDEYNLDEMDEMILTNFLRLNPEERKLIISIGQKLLDLSNSQNEVEKETNKIKKFPKQEEEERVQIIARGEGITTISKEEYDRIMETAQEIDNIDDYF